MSKLERIHTFVTVIEQNSFSKAAKKLNTAATTITRQINALEHELGVKLIERTTRRLKLTEIGARYYQEAKKLIEQLINSENLIAQTHKEPSGKFTVLAHRYFADTFITPYLAEFMQRYPKINLHLTLSEIAPDFTQENFDLLFGTLGDGAPGLIRRRIASGKFIFCASKKYLDQYGTPKKPEDLIQHKFITHTIRQPPDLVTFYKHPPLYLNPILWLNDSETMIDAALQGIGVIKILDFRITTHFASKRLIPILEKYAEPDYPVYLYYRGTHYPDPKIRAFIDFFIEKIKFN